MTYPILIRSKPNDGYVATALTLSNVEVEAPTRELALEQIRQIISDTLAEGEVVDLEIPGTEQISAAPYSETFGMFKDDPTYSEFLEEVKKYRGQQSEKV